MEQWMEIRRRVLIEGISKRQILRETGMHWTTLEKILAKSEPPGYRQQKNRPKPKIGPWLGRLEEILKAEGHVRSFERLGGVPRRITYDNSKIAVSKILGAHERKLTRAFLQLKSHYLFDHHFCRVRRTNEKGVVEGAVKYARQNFMVPVPEARDLEELNQQLRECCLADARRTVRGAGATKAQRLQQDQAAFLTLPPAPFPACRLASTAASSLSLVRFDDNEYSVPVAYAHRPIVAKGFLERVELCHKGQLVATHQRIWEKEQIHFEPVHYLALLERKPGALDYARPLEGWTLPESFATLRRRLERELEGGAGTREYIGVLRLLEKHPLHELTRAVERGLEVRAHRRDAIAQFLLPREQWRPATFSLDGREHLRAVTVAGPDLAAYRGLLGEGGAQ